MSHSQSHCTGLVYLDLHGFIFETSICYWQDQPGSPPLSSAAVGPPTLGFCLFLREGSAGRGGWASGVRMVGGGAPDEAPPLPKTNPSAAPPRARAGKAGALGFPSPLPWRV